MLRRLTSTLALLLLAAASASAEVLPRPPALEPNVRFWTRIYTEIDTQSGLIHDSEYLDVVYETLRLPAGLSTRARERYVEQAKRRYTRVLLELAAGNRSGLSPDAARVLGLWPDGTANATFRAAARNVRFQLGQADKFRAGLLRAGQWRSHIEQVLAAEGVPPELVALPHVESSFNPKAYSRVGAAGLWQFTRSTGRLFMRVDDVVDERMDPHKASVAAARLLRHNYGRTDSWPLAITAYNHGVAGMERAVRTLGTRDIATIVAQHKSRSFGFASRNFYSEFLAASEIDRDPERFFGPLDPLPEGSYEVVTLDSYYKAASLQRAFGISMDALRDENLALRPSVWSGAKYVPRGYQLRVPKHYVTQAVDQVLASIPTNEKLAEQHRDKYYKVRRGDTLSRIAARQGIAMRDLAALNGLRGRNTIRVGQVLRLPDDAIGAQPVATVARVEPLPSDRIHRVRRGETIASIARSYGVSEAEIAEANDDLRSRNKIVVGQRLRLPGAAQPAPAVVTAAQPVVAAAEPAAPAASEAMQPAPQPSAGVTIVSAAEPAPAPAREPQPGAPVTAATPAAQPAPVVAEAPTPAPIPVPASAPAATASEPVVVASNAPVAPPAPVPAAKPQEQAAASADDRADDAPAPGSPDPSNYAVSSDNRITVQADETLGHYAEWLEIRPSVLRKLNKMKPGTPVRIGRTTRLDFSRVTPEVFEQRRLEYHVALQEEFFAAYTVSGTETYVLGKGETIWYLAKRKFEMPVWLLRQYNPDLDFGALRAGTTMVVPVIEPRDPQT
jgi:membrane-bound lytic murein transglycosylase D